MNPKRTIATLGVAALVACPAAAMAKSPKSGGPDKPAPAGVTEGKPSKEAKPKKPKVSTYEFKGLVSAVGAGTVQVAVNGGNSRGRKFSGQTLTFDLSKAKIKVADVNKDGKRDLADVAAGDRVNVQAKLPRGAVDATQPLAARHFVDKGPVPAPETEPETAAPVVTEPPAS